MPYVWVDEGPPDVDAQIEVYLTREEAERLVAILFRTERSGMRPPGSTLHTQLRRAGIEPDPDARRVASRWVIDPGDGVAIVSDQYGSWWDTPEGGEYLASDRW